MKSSGRRNGELTRDPLAVDYNTGFLTTGKDWWLITWFHPDMKRIWYSSPNNMRGFFDFADNLLPDAIAGAAGAVAGLGTSFTGPGAIAAGRSSLPPCSTRERPTGSSSTCSRRRTRAS
ncbi:hypothetical protein B0H13DRAFT_2498866 [Mycena leptocephala]|nr:hypothetical protein B0H13DRAFT_2498866 [Mycena leptocephala]